jgi:hypothetical protein
VSDQHSSTPEESTPPVPTPSRQTELTLPPALQSLIDLERQRIDSNNRRTEVTRYAIETNDAADQRQFDFQMAKLRSEDHNNERRHSLAANISIYAGVASAVILALLLGMAFLAANLKAISL